MGRGSGAELQRVSISGLLQGSNEPIELHDCTLEAAIDQAVVLPVPVCLGLSANRLRITTLTKYLLKEVKS